MDYYLAIETSTAPCSVALLQGKDLLEECFIEEAKQTSALLAHRTEELLVRHQIKASTLKRIMVSIGPGSYTGLRVGLSFAKGLAYALSIPIQGVPSLKALSLGYCLEEKDTADFIIPMYNARRENVYCAIYDKEKNEVMEPTLLSFEALYKKAKEYNNFVFVSPDSAILNKIFKLVLECKNLGARAYFVGYAGLTNEENALGKGSAYLAPLYITNNYL
ncbi:MAG: tRNA (adenosine(37)-N6)-threonylcarbamoyltransferase complex dimerization subunit type 1 TsaB [Saprospiraceae bacterium]|nr:tRNA (adenosine(37)-N6)-threonylcarbamoyltransferase complex dimerization subunit type 1 TsaB [Saprospiraceae bacterium]